MGLPHRRPRLVRMTTVPMALRFLLTGQLAYMQQAGMDVMAISSPGPLLDALASEGIQTYGVVMPRRVSPWQDLKALPHLIRVLRAARPDIMHTHTPKAGLLGMLAAWCADVPIRIHTYAGAPYDGTQGLSVALAKQADRMTARIATTVWSVGWELARYLEAEGVVPPGQIDVISNGSSNGIDVQAFFPAPRTTPHDPPQLMWIGRLARDKGLEELLTLWAVIRDTCPGATLDIVGPMDERDPLPPAVQAALDGDGRIRTAGFQIDIAQRLTTADLFLFTSRREGLPGVVLQAQAAGVPVVALRCTGLADALADGVGGRIFERTGITEAGHEAVRILRNPANWQKYRHHGRRFVETHFERQRFHAALLWRYEDLLVQNGIRYSMPTHYAA